MLDRNRFRLALKARQIGFSTAIAFECFRDAVAGRNSLIVSASEKNAQEVLRKCRLWVEGVEITSARTPGDNLQVNVYVAVYVPGPGGEEDDANA